MSSPTIVCRESFHNLINFFEYMTGKDLNDGKRSELFLINFSEYMTRKDLNDGKRSELFPARIRQKNQFLNLRNFSQKTLGEDLTKSVTL